MGVYKEGKNWKVQVYAYGTSQRPGLRSKTAEMRS